MIQKDFQTSGRKLISKDDVKIIRKLANKNICKILDNLGIIYEERYQYICGPCPVHGGDRNDAFSWHLDYGMWQCFSRGCHDQYGKDIFALIRGIKDIDFWSSVRFISDILKIKDTDISKLTEEEVNQNFVKRTPKPEIVYPDSCINQLLYSDYLETRGYPRWLIEKYQIGITTNKYKKMSDRVIIPIRNIDSKIVGFTGRTIFKDWKERGIGKWEHSKDFRKERNLFNINFSAPYIKDSGIAILCEGPLDVLRLEEANIHNGVAIFGRKLHNEQIGLLIKVGANKLIFALDADIAGRTGTEAAIKVASSFFKTHDVNIQNGDIGAMNASEVEKVFKCLLNGD